MRWRWPQLLAAFGVLTLGAAQALAEPVVLDWDQLTWLPEGNTNLSETYTVGNQSLTVTITGNTAELDQDAGSSGLGPISPSINSQNTGGLVPVEDGLHIATDYSDQSNPEVTVTIDFSQYPGGVSDIAFSMFDIDASGSFLDRATVTAVNGSGVINPTSRVTSPSNQLFGANAIEGTASAGGSTANGNATFGFSQSGITELRITYSNEVNRANPGFQFMNIHDISFDAPVADVGIEKTASDLAPSVGSDITFTLTATNNGPDDAPAVTISDALPAGYTYVSDTGGGDYNSGTGVWTIGALANGATDAIDIVATVNSSGPYANTATVTGTGIDDDNPGNDSATVTPVPVNEADLRLQKSVTPAEPRVGETVTFTLTLTNDGIGGATGVAVLDQLPSGFAYVSDTPSQGGYASGTGIWSVGALANGGTATLDIVATVQATGSYVNSAQVSASDQNDPDSTPGNNVPSEDDQDDAAVSPVQVGIAKTVSNGPTSNGDGTFTLTYTVTIANTGGAVLNAVQATDDLTATFGATPFVVDSVTSTDFAANGAFNGAGDTNLLAGTDTLGVGVSGTVAVTVTVTPGANLGPFNNAADVSATSPGGTSVTDTSTDGTNVDPNGNGDPTDDTSPTPVSFSEAPEIGAAKRADAPINNGDGTYDVTYTLIVANTGDVPLGNVQITDSLATTFSGATFTVATPTSANLTVNAGFNGSGDTNVLAGTDSLASGASGEVQMVVTVTPGANLGPYNNAVTASGSSPSGTPVSDLSTDGSDVDPDGNGDPGNNSVPTPVSFTESPQIGTAKAVTAGPTNNGDGTYDLTYTITVANTGDVSLTSVQVAEDLATTFSGATFTVGTVSSADFAINAAFNGIGNTDLLDGSDTLAAGASGTIVLPLTITPGANLGPYNNTATASGDAPSGTSLSDASTDGADVDPNGNGNPGDDSAPTPVSFGEAPQIGTAKAVTAGPTNNGDGTYALTYTILVENTGDVALDAVQVLEDLATTFSGADGVVAGTPTSTDFAINPGFNGAADTSLLLGTDALAVGASGSIVVPVTVTPGANLGPYDNTAQASGDSPAGTTVTDDSTDGGDVDPGGNGDPTDDSVPTPASFAEAPEIGLAKQVTAGPASNGDGSFTLTYSLLVENTGDITLTNVQVSDTLATTFADATSFTVANPVSADLTVNGAFDGDGDSNVLAGTDTLSPGATGTVTFEVTVTPGADLGPYDNSAAATGTSPSGATASDNSVDGADVDPNGNGDPTDDTSPTPVSFVEMPQIGVAKAIVSPPTNDGSGNFTFQYAIRVDNTGDVALENVQVTDDLGTVFAAATSFTVNSVTSADFAVNAGFDGAADQSLLAGTDTLAPAATGEILIDLTVAPGGNLGPYNNTATGDGTSPGGTAVSDVSQSGANADPDSNGDPTDNNDPTPVSFNEMPEVGAAKILSAGPTSNGDGTFSLTYTILVENTGDVVLAGLQIVEDFDTTFATASTYTVGTPVSSDFTINPGFDGSGDTNVLAGSDSLALATSGTVDIPVTVTPGADLGPYENVAQAEGTSPAGTPVSDITTDGNDVDPDATDGPGNNATPTPVTFVESPQIGVAKALVGAPANNSGVYTVVYDIVIENTGDVDLNSVQVSDDLTNTFGGAVSFTVISRTSADFAPNASYDGVTVTDLLQGSDTLAAGASGTVRLTVQVTPGANLGPYTNTANVSGVSPGGTPVADVSTDGSDVDPDGNNDPSNNSVPTPVTFAEMPQIGVAKSVTDGPTNNADGTTSATYTLVVENTGDIPLLNVQVTDDLATTFGAVPFSVVSTSSPALTLNPLFDGDGNTNVLAGSDALAVGARETIAIEVVLTPAGALGPFDNTARATGTTAAGNPATDDSVDGTNVDPTADSDPTNDTSPTPLVLTEMPVIGVAKTVSAAPAANGDGSFTLTYTLNVANLGDVALESVQVTDSLATTFAGATSFVVDAVSSPTLSANGGFDGAATTDLLSGLDTLAIGASAAIDITVTVLPGANLGPYNNAATATGQSPGGTPTSDDSVDGTVPDFDGNGDPGNDTSPTPVSFMEMPRVGLAKSVDGAPINNGDGTFTLTYTLTVDNVGDVAISALQVSDDLTNTFAGASFVVDGIASADFATNGAYDGDGDTSLLAGTDTLAPGATGTVDITATVTPAGVNLGPFNNTATVTGQSPAGEPVSDVSQSGVNADPDADGDPGNNNDPTPVSFTEAPQVGTAKQLDAAPTSNGDGTFNLNYTIAVENTGDVALAGVQVVEDFDTTFAAADSYSVLAVTSTDFAVNPAFDGSANSNLLAGTDVLGVGARGAINIAVRVTPGANLGPYENTATATGTSPAGTPVSDDSTDGADPDPDANDNPGDNGDPTPATFTEAPQIGVAKALAALPTSNGDGSFTLTYSLTVQNTGDVTLNGVQVTDALATTFAGANAFGDAIVTSPDFAPNPNYDGQNDTNLLVGGDTLAPTESGTVNVTVTVTPGANLGPYDNLAEASGTSPGGAPVTDTSTDGSDVDPDSDGNPGNNSVPTPTVFDEMPVIGTAKMLELGPTPNGDGSFTLSYDVRVENVGDVMLERVQVVDDLAATFNGAIGFDDVSVTSSELTVNAGYDGRTDTNLLAGTDQLDTGQNGTVRITVYRHAGP